MTLRAVSLFAGIGGFDLGLTRAGFAGFTVTDQIECDPFCQRILAARFPHAARWPDVRQWPSDRHEHVDLVCGGFPCQDLSIAGKRAGLAGARSGLFWEIVRIAKAIKPTWGLFENVPGLLSSHRGRDMASVLEGLRECWPVVGYRVLDSQYFGVAQRRRRLFFVCGPTEAGVEQVLFESEGGSGDFAAGAEAGKDVAASLGSRAARPGGSAVAATLDQRGRGTSDGVMQNLQVCQALTNLGSGGPDDNEAQAGHLVTHGIGVRRLTPTECERLQGFPDGWTCLCQPLDNYDSNQCTCPDTPRYRTLGNAVTVSVAEWLGRRIARSA